MESTKPTEGMSLEELKREILKEQEKISQLRTSMQECKDYEKELEQNQAVGEAKAEEVEEKVDKPKKGQKPSGKSDTEWKIRFESQQALNERLREQLKVLKTKVSDAQKDLKTLMDGGQIDFFKGENPKKKLISLKRQKKNLESDLKDLEWRLDHEAEAYYKADEKRRALLADVKTKAGPQKTKSKVPQALQQPDKKGKPVKPKPKVDSGSYSKRLAKVSKPTTLKAVKEK